MIVKLKYPRKLKNTINLGMPPKSQYIHETKRERCKISRSTGAEISLLYGNERSVPRLWRCGNDGNEF